MAHFAATGYPCYYRMAHGAAYGQDDGEKSVKTY